MRQAGVLAAAGLIALEEHPALLGRDHENARWLAGELAKIPGIAIDPKRVETNILIFDISGSGLSTNEFSTRLKSHGVLFNGINAREMRIVTHYDVDRAGCERALSPEAPEPKRLEQQQGDWISYVFVYEAGRKSLLSLLQIRFTSDSAAP